MQIKIKLMKIENPKTTTIEFFNLYKASSKNSTSSSSSMFLCKSAMGISPLYMKSMINFLVLKTPPAAPKIPSKVLLAWLETKSVVVDNASEMSFDRCMTSSLSETPIHLLKEKRLT